MTVEELVIQLNKLDKTKNINIETLDDFDDIGDVIVEDNILIIRSKMLLKEQNETY